MSRPVAVVLCGTGVGGRQVRVWLAHRFRRAHSGATAPDSHRLPLLLSQVLVMLPGAGRNLGPWSTPVPAPMHAPARCRSTRRPTVRSPGCASPAAC
ncbi:hypothetical protein Rhow_005467 [Rhodococcus wratislaviensis]|uniref:Uncharacterized protein n=1 Tax=Rhodococcus wratislaviensis TaxID=44752 RepID=A0A402CDZ7_RHOWR|nr:hypothetical protein Rhow_005467 [Rhodococcus wratislaviensis]